MNPSFEILRPAESTAVPLVVHVQRGSLVDKLAEVATALGGTLLAMHPEHFDEQAFEDLVAEQLARFGRCLVVNMGSFPRIALPDEDASLPRPPVCIGFDAFHVDPELRDVWVELANTHDFEVGLNVPFAGSLVPQRFYGEDRRVRSLTASLRRDLSMDETSGAKAASFHHAQMFVRTLLTAAADQASGLATAS